jgi:hypothetical protein
LLRRYSLSWRPFSGSCLAYGEFPQMATVDNLLLAAFGGAAIMTSWAAALSCASALCAAARLLL